MAELNLVEKVMALEGVELFERLNPDQLARLAAIAQETRLPPHTTVFEANEELAALYVLLEGAIVLYRDGEQLHTAGPGEVLGTWALLDPEPMPVRAVTREDARALRINRADFYDLLADNVEIMASILSMLVKRFRALVGQ